MLMDRGHAAALRWRVYGHKLGAGPKRRVSMHGVCVCWPSIFYASSKVPPGRSCKQAACVGVIMNTNYTPPSHGSCETAVVVVNPCASSTASSDAHVHGRPWLLSDLLVAGIVEAT